MVKEKEKQNAKQFPCIYYAKHMETGLAGYESETILIETDNLKSMIPSFIGKPVYVNHQEVDLDNLKEQAHGYIVESFYNELDGWLWVKMLLVDDMALEAVANNWSVSNAYVPTEWGPGGLHHNCPYDRKIVNGEFTHLAIVPNPRYEEAGIFSPDEYKIYQDEKRRKLDELKNSKPEKPKGKSMFKFLKNTKQEVAADQVDNETLLEIKNDDGSTSEIKLADMIGTVLNAKKNETDEKEKEEKEKTNMDTMVTVGDEPMTVRDLMNKYNALKSSKKNAEDEDESDEKENADESDDKDEKDEKKNAKSDDDTNHFDELKNAKDKAKPEVRNTTDLGLGGVTRGQNRYGSAALKK